MQIYFFRILKGDNEFGWVNGVFAILFKFLHFFHPQLTFVVFFLSKEGMRIKRTTSDKMTNDEN